MGVVSRVLASSRVLRLALNLYPPYLGAGVRVTRLDRDLRGIRVELPLRWFNRNYVGTQFGGSLYSMTDPFLMLMLLRNLGSDYVVWDKAARIEFVRPGKGRVHAEFSLAAERLAEIRATADRERRALPEFEVVVRDEDGEPVARVHKTLYVRRKRPSGAPAAVCD
ncbi:MAG: DUF4442 domain-containing protein [Planctomycetota bacterium]